MAKLTDIYSNKNVFGINNPYAPKAISSVKTPMSTPAVASKKTSTPGIGQGIPSFIPQDEYINQYVNSLGIKNTGGGVNLGGLYSAYQQQADADRATLSGAVSSKKSDLTVQMQRLRENIEASKKARTQEYQGTRADLEESGFMATRANRASAASRGLTGSGLEQLAQLQQMIRQNKAVSKESNINQTSQDALRKELVEGEQDYGRNIQNLTTEELAQLQKINANLASSKSEAASRAASANASASANYNNALMSARETALKQYQSGVTMSSSIIDAYKSATKKGLSSKDKKRELDKADALYTQIVQGGYIDPSLLETLNKQRAKYVK